MYKYIRITANMLQYSSAQKRPPDMGGPFAGKKRHSIYTEIYIRLLTGNKNPVHGCKLCCPCTANFQYTKMKKPA